MNFITKMRAVGPVNYILGFVAKSVESQRVQQEHVDLARAAVLLKGFSWLQSNCTTEDNKKVYAVPQPDQIEKFFSDVDKMTPKAVKSLVQKSVESQVVEMFRKIYEREQALNGFEGDADGEGAVKKQAAQDVKSLEESFGYEVECKESTIFRAGQVRDRYHSKSES